ncbi:MAG: hypothetical protein AMXMBFR46_22920 [Acidimicrobiia bacterium]
MAQPRDASEPARPRSFGAPPRPSLPQLVLELRDLVVTYLKQETVVPLKALGRYLAFGVAGSLLMGTGVLLLALGCLRLLQTETGDTFTGDWSWVPYVIVFAALVLGAALAWTARKTFRVSKELQR